MVSLGYHDIVAKKQPGISINNMWGSSAAGVSQTLLSVFVIVKQHL